uniref:Uncharacterized protein n=1 Tax=Arundo donax TaxID=35708 RepID=A0A0A9C3V7_ARUDO
MGCAVAFYFCVKLLIEGRAFES